MPFDDNSDDNEQGQNGQPLQGSSGQPLGPSGGVISGGAPGQGGGLSAAIPSTPTAPTSSGGFTNLQNYLNANQDQGNQFASQLAGDVQGQIGQAQGLQNSMNTAYQNDLSNATINDNSNLDSQIASGNAASVVGDQGNVNQFQNELNAANNWNPNLNSVQTDQNSNYNNAYLANQNAQQQAQNTQTGGGQYQLLNQYFSAPQYTQGEQNLDQFLLGQNTAGSNGENVFNQFQQAPSSLQNSWNNALTTDSGAMNNALSTNQATQGAAQNALYGTPSGGNAQSATGGAYGALNTALQSQLATDQANNAAIQNAYNNFEGNLSGIIGLGLNSADQSVLQNAANDVGNGLTQGQLAGLVTYAGPQNENINGVANASQQAQLAALGQLSGNPYTAPTGQYTPGSTSFNLNGLLQTLGATQGANGTWQAPTVTNPNVAVNYANMSGGQALPGNQANTIVEPNGQVWNFNTPNNTITATPQQLQNLGATQNPDGTWLLPSGQTVGTPLTAQQSMQNLQAQDLTNIFGGNPAAQQLYQQLFGQPYPQ